MFLIITDTNQPGEHSHGLLPSHVGFSFTLGCLSTSWNAVICQLLIDFFQSSDLVLWRGIALSEQTYLDFEMSSATVRQRAAPKPGGSGLGAAAMSLTRKRTRQEANGGVTETVLGRCCPRRCFHTARALALLRPRHRAGHSPCTFGSRACHVKRDLRKWAGHPVNTGCLRDVKVSWL